MIAFLAISSLFFAFSLAQAHQPTPLDHFAGHNDYYEGDYRGYNNFQGPRNLFAPKPYYNDYNAYRYRPVHRQQQQSYDYYNPNMYYHPTRPIYNIK